MGATLLAVAEGFAWSDPPETWRSSCFVYRDINRNGLYDMGDRLYAGLVVELERPDGSVVRSASNIDGFANFEMVPGDTTQGDIYGPGLYELRAVPPRGWTSQGTENLHQQLKIVEKRHAGSGMVPLQPCRHIGVMPELTVTGQVAAEPGTLIGQVAAIARGPGAAPVELELDEAGYFRFPATAGEWVITIADSGSGKSATRRVEVGSYNLILSAISLADTQLPERDGRELKVGFDDLIGSAPLLEIPSGYAGLHWNYWIATHNRFYGGAGYINGTVSGEYMAYNSSGVPASISREEPFDFLGTHISAAWPRGEQDEVLVRGWRSGEVVYEDHLLIVTSGPSYFDADYRSIDRLEFSMGNYERIVIDDFDFRY